MVSLTGRTVRKSIPFSQRVQDGYEAIQEGRFRKKPLWDAQLTVLNDETVKFPLVKRRALAISKQLAEMPVGFKDYELLVGDMFQTSPVSGIPDPG